MSETLVQYARGSGDPIVSRDGWRASFIPSIFTKGNYVLAAQAPDKRMLFGLTPKTGFIVEQRRKPTVDQVKAFLADCISGKIVTNTLEALGKQPTAS